ncbi:MAG: hypothetical protein J6T82_08515 [Bacteroidaceae bacterium]|nr:hypothetical protein [Bacteroidaceae bacterium]
MARFKKGESGNPKGRPLGSKNEKSAYIRDWVVSLIGTNSHDLLATFKNLNLKEKWKIIVALMPYAIPRQVEQKIDANVDLSSLDDRQLDLVIDGLINELADE